jgi:hypothetical protein
VADFLIAPLPAVPCSLVGLLSLIMEIPFFFKIHTWFEKINELTSKFSDLHKAIAYAVYVIPLSVRLP